MNLALVVASENTAQPHARYYWATSENLAPGATTTVKFRIDLSPPVTHAPGPQESGRFWRSGYNPRRGFGRQDRRSGALIGAADASADAAGAGASKIGSFTRPTNARASSPTSTVLPKSARINV